MAEQIGVVGAFDTVQFNAGLNTYINGLLRAQSATVSAVTRINSLISSIKPIRPVNLANVVTGSSNNTKDVSATVTQINRLSKAQPIPSAVLSSINGLSIVLNKLSQVPNLDTVSKNLTTISRGMGALGKVQGISPAVAQTLNGFVTSLGGLSSISNLNPTIKSLGTLVRLLNSLSSIKAPQGSIFQTLSGIVNVLGRLSAIPNLGNISSISTMITGLNRLSKLQPIPAGVVTSIQQVLGNLSKFAGSNLSGLSNLASILNNLAPAIRNYGAAAQQADRQQISFFQSLSQGIGVGIGAVAIGLFVELKNSLVGLVQESYQAIQFFEGFRLSLQTVVAAELVAADGTLKFADALELGQDKARAFELILGDLAIKSKFTTQQIATGFQTAISQGFDPDVALRVTKALVDFTSGRGLSAEKLNSIALALAQIQSRGKLSAQEINQLSEAGVNVKQILEQAFKKTPVELQQLIEDGLGAKAVLEAIIGTMERDFAGAAERSQNTLSGLISSLIDLKERGQALFFDKVFSPSIPILQELVAKLASPEFTATLTVIADLIGNKIAGAILYLRGIISGLVQSFVELSPETKKTILVLLAVAAATTLVAATIGGLVLLLGALVNPFTILIGAVTLFVTGWIQGFDKVASFTANAVNSILGTTNTLLGSLVEWGANIIGSLAEGIVSAVGLIIDALSVVGQAIQYLLQPGSPPRLLPDLDKWGTGAAEAYLDGWTKAQFTALDTFGSLIEKKIRQGVQLGTISEASSFDLQLVGRKQIADAIQQIQQVGFAAQDTINNIASVTGFPLEIIQRLLTRYADVASATKNVAEAQATLNSITQKYDQLLAPLEAKLAAINTAADRAEDEDKLIKLRRIAANQTVSEARRQQALAEIEKIGLENEIDGLKTQQQSETDLAQTRLDAANTQLTLAQEQLDLYMSQLNVQTANVDILIQQKQFFTDIVKAVGSIGDKLKEGLTPLEKQLQAVKMQQDELNDMIELKRQEAILNDASASAAEKAAAQLKIQEIQIRRNIRALDAKEAGVDLSAIQSVPITLEDISKKGKGASDSIASLGGKLEGLKAINVTDTLKAFDDKLKEVKGSFDDIGISVTTFFDNLDARLPSFLKLKQQADGTRPGLELLGKVLLGLGAIMIGAQVIGAITTLITALTGIVTTIGAVGAATGVAGAISGIAALLAPAAPLLLGLAAAALAIRLLYVAWSENWGGIKDKTYAAVDAITKKVAEINNSEFAKKLRETGDGIWAGIRDGIVAGLGYIIPQEIAQAFGVFLDAMKLWWGISSPSTKAFDEIGDPIGLGLINGIIQSIKDNTLGVVVSFTDMITSVFSQETVDFAIGKATALGTSIIDGLKTAFSDPVGSVKGAFKSMIDGIFGAGEEEAEIQSPSKRAKRDIGDQISAGIAEGLTVASLLGVVASFIGSIITLFVGMAASILVSVAGLSLTLLTTFLTLSTNLTTTTTNMVTVMIASYTLLQTDVTTIVTLLSATVVLLLTTLKDTTVILTEDMRSQIVDALERAADGAKIAAETLKSNVLGELSKLLESIRTDFVAEGEDVGEDFIRGIIKGIINQIDEVKDAAEKAVNEAVSAAKKAAKAKSPSRRAADEVGAPIAQGIAVGMQEQMRSLMRSSFQVTNGIFDALNSQVQGRLSPSSTTNISNTNVNNWNLSVASQQSTGSIRRDFGIMQVMAG